MANHLSALKRARQTVKRSATNRTNTSRLRGVLREMREAIAKGDKAAAETTYRATVSALDKAIQKGVLHKNTAARYKTRLSARVRALSKKRRHPAGKRRARRPPDSRRDGGATRRFSKSKICAAALCGCVFSRD